MCRTSSNRHTDADGEIYLAHITFTLGERDRSVHHICPTINTKTYSRILPHEVVSCFAKSWLPENYSSNMVTYNKL